MTNERFFGFELDNTKKNNVEINSESTNQTNNQCKVYIDVLEDNDDEGVDWFCDEVSRINEWNKRQIKIYELSQRRLERNLEILPEYLTEVEIMSINDDRARSYVNLYYKKSNESSNYALSVKNDDLIYSGGDDYLCSYLVFKQGKVVWVDFGENVGCELSGIHPALIVARPKNDLLTVLPIVYREESERNPSVVIISIENDNNRGGVALINEIRNISINRVDRSMLSRNISVDDFNRTLGRITEYYSDMFTNSKSPYFI